jgi:predicted nucleic-acid-binding protein
MGGRFMSCEGTVRKNGAIDVSGSYSVQSSPDCAMRAVDTNGLVRLMTRDDVKQVAVAEAFVTKGAWVPQLAIAEATWVLGSVYNRVPEAIATAVEMLLSHEHLTVQDAEAVAAAVALFRQQPEVGFSDCLMVEVARKAGHTPLGTFDRELGKVDGAQRL